MGNGCFSYGVTFDAEVAEGTSDEGAAIKDAAVKTIEFQSISTSAISL